MRIASPLTTESEPCLQWIELASSFQIPSFYIIGLPAPEVAEARERVRAAIDASGFEFPKRRILINLSPASIRKRGTGLDLAMALAILASTSPDAIPSPLAAWGELGLDGSLKPCGQLTRSLFAAWQEKIPYFLISEDELGEAKRVRSLIAEAGDLPHPPPLLIAAKNLKSLWQILSKGHLKETPSALEISPPSSGTAFQEASARLLNLPKGLKRTLCASAAGAHHLLLLGPRGSGKTHALEWLLALQPPLSKSTQLKNRLLSELSGTTLHETSLVPVRRVGPQARPSALLGGNFQGTLRAGDYSLAHGGLLIADEFPEWARDSRESLRDPLERGKVCINRIPLSVELPARFTLAATGNFCPCGGMPPHFPRPLKTSSLPVCHCKKSVKESYLARLSGPILDRVDLVSLVIPEEGQPSGDAQLDLWSLQEQVALAHDLLRRRYGGVPSQLPSQEIESYISARKPLEDLLTRLSLSSFRSRHKAVRVAMTLAALDGQKDAETHHLQEALLYRPERLGVFS